MRSVVGLRGHLDPGSCDAPLTRSLLGSAKAATLNTLTGERLQGRMRQWANLLDVCGFRLMTTNSETIALSATPRASVTVASRC